MVRYLPGVFVLAMVGCGGELPADEMVEMMEMELHGSQPAELRSVPSFEALNSDDSMRDSDALRGRPVVLWFSEFSGPPG